jgi:hypothetical protein
MQMMDAETELLERLPGPTPPPWALPIEMRHAEYIDRSVVTLAEASNWEHLHMLDWERFYRLVHYVWNERLPVSAEEMRQILSMHGVPEERGRELANIYDHGRSILMLTKYKPPARTRRLREPPL